MLRAEVGKGRLCGLLSLGDSTSIYCLSSRKQQKTDEITPYQRAFLFLLKTTGTSAIVTIKKLQLSAMEMEFKKAFV
jgi:hypothetical protein